MDQQLLEHIVEIAKIPSFSSYEQRLHPYFRSLAEQSHAEEIPVEGNSLIFRSGSKPSDDQPVIAFAAHLDKNNHYGKDWVEPLEVNQLENELEGPMDDSAGLGVCARLMELADQQPDWPTTYFLFSEMEESLGLKKHPEWMKNEAAGLEHGIGAKRIARTLIGLNEIPDQVITVDTTPLFKGDPGLALYANHWEINDLDPTDALKEATQAFVDELQQISPDIKVDNNTNDYLHYGFEFNQQTAKPVVSVALEPAIYPYHQAGERVFYDDLQQTLEILTTYLNSSAG
jgi:hypothetical protein